MSHPVWLIAKQEFTLNRRNRWVISFAVVFSVLTILVSLLGMVTSGYSGFQDFVRTSASIINLDGFIVPLFALLLGVFSFLSHREHLELMVTQPISRAKIILGKYLGLLLTVIGATLLGFGLPGIVFSLAVGVEGAFQYFIVVLLALLLSVVFTGLAVLISLLSRRQQIALGVSVGLWIFFELLYGMLMLGTTLHFSHATLKVLLLAGLTGNPVDLTRVLSLLVIGGPHFFGPAGATLIKLTGSASVASLLGLAAILLWIVIPMLVSIRVFSRQNL
ncbi:MAG: ABC transporter permease subunit [Candidatus Latescibacteria bacterium]|nr:ABC transporter permease subunit [Candidatus Latescibacterota bacterium]NIM22700.1 ABC transporter permease subunit [Candidatus Latescibacterota bacterium]NIM64989.1 ABC transporter permease subunit [Candidatus Latescibacterota bacterium]NIO01504.1 ABC transporter permease subunit [Candidatus Latescibacterota bacterium]NIO28013.1 ABC transporter permease subunit [Candidatus Latescibacterota bacterium]